jgi:hypothetical protein
MSTLSQLNTYSNNTIEFTDNRPSGIKLTWPNPRNIIDFVATGSNFPVERRVDIEEIINPNGTLNLTYSINLSSVAGAYLTWDPIFGGSITNIQNGVYSISPINSIADWELVRAPLITLPDNFQGTFEYTCTLTYLADSGLTSQSWTVGSFVPVANLSAVFTEFVTPVMFKGVGPIRLSSEFTLLGGGLEFDIAEANFASNFVMATTARRALRGYSSLQNVTASISASGTYTLGKLKSSLSASFNKSFIADRIEPITNLNVVRTFRSNQSNAIFGTNTPVIQVPGDSGTYEVVVTCANGGFGDAGFDNITDDVFSYTGNKFDTNIFIRDLIFYPDKNFAVDTSMNFKLYRNGVLFRNVDIVLDYAGVGFTGRNVEYTSSGTFTPTVQELRYSTMHYMVIGGGGGMSVIPATQPDASSWKGNTAGGGGDVLHALNQPITNTTYSFTVGAGGGRGSAGGTSTGFGLTALGGQPGIDTDTPFEFASTYSNAGGASANGNKGSSGQPWRNGGAGGGAGGQAGTSGIGGFRASTYPSFDSGGAGVRVSSISGSFYGVGGNGTYSNYSPQQLNDTSSTTAGSGGGETGTGFGGAGTGQAGAVIISTFTI